MRVRVARDKCQGHAMCNAVAPSVYPIDDDGYVDIEAAEVAEPDRAAAMRGVETCPERAIAVED
jgi:ferredoxin